MPIQIKYTTEVGIFSDTLFNNSIDQTWNITTNGKPISVEFDPDNWILKDVLEITKVEATNSFPTNFSLSQNYPNPFNPSTTIKYSIPTAGAQNVVPVQLKIFDVLGKEVATLINEVKPAGNYSVSFKAENLASGIYMYTLKAGDFFDTKKMIYLK